MKEIKEEIEKELNFNPEEKEKNPDDGEELDIYTEEGMENYVDEDSISASEEGFMIGYLDA